MNKTFIIAEAGANHNRDIEQAYELIEIASNAKADAVKFQTYSSDTLYAKNTPDFGVYKNINKLIKDIELPREWQRDLMLYCEDLGIEFISTPFDKKAVDELYSLGVRRFKIAGFEALDPRFVKYVATTGLPLLISLGIGSDFDSLSKIHGWVLDACSSTYVTYLHCNNAYPTPFEDINLGTLLQLKKYCKSFPHLYVHTNIGLSDHTEGILVPPIAVALGAEVIEKHFTINRKLPGPDHSFAIEPDELVEMIANIRLAEKLGRVKKGRFTHSEQNFRSAMRSVVVQGKITKKSIVSEDNITTKRPLLRNSIPAMEYYNILGKRFTKDLVDDSVLTWEDIE